METKIQKIKEEIKLLEKDFSERDRRGFIWTKKNSKWCDLRAELCGRIDTIRDEIKFLEDEDWNRLSWQRLRKERLELLKGVKE